jgi:hypothetical protein
VLLLIELCLTALVVPLAWVAPRLGESWLRAAERLLQRLAARRGLAVLTILALALGARLAVLRVEPIPQPGVHDEFSYLLMADTLAHGRLTNPPHPMWVHFETFHVNLLPTYCSKYFPAQGLFLALGQVGFHHPFWGVWLSTGLMCAAICWALQGWMPPGWAFLGGVLAILRLGIFSYWANSYWGGSVAAFGGALVLGALPRIKRKLRVRDVVLLGIGLAILANSRPYEGLIYCLPILIALSAWLLRQKERPLSVLLRRAVLPLGIVLALSCGAMGYYFWKTTGSPLRIPYAVNSARYDAAPFFPWQKVKSIPTYDHVVMERFYLGYAMDQYILARKTPWLAILKRMLVFWLFFVGAAFTLPFIVVSWLLPYGISLNGFGIKVRLLLLINMISFGSLLIPTYFNLHYAAPMICAWYALLMFCLRRLWIWDHRRRQKGRFLVRGIVFVCVAMGVLRTLSTSSLGSDDPFASVGSLSTVGILRAQVVKGLKEQVGQHLVIVRYSANHNSLGECVYNNADIDSSAVVWARDMGEAKNLELIRYFKERKIWLLEPDLLPPRLSVYPMTQATSGSDMGSD